MRSVSATLVLSLLVLISLTGCASTVVLHPISKSDIFSVTKGTTIGTQVTEKDGWFLSDYYMNEVGKAKVK